MAAGWHAADGSGISLHVRLTPRAGRDAVDGVEIRADGKARLNVRVRAVPEKGAANAALEALLAGVLRLPRSTVSVSTGQTAREKTVRIAVAPDAGLLARLEALAG